MLLTQPHFFCKQSGFTLIELLVTVAILGILSSISLAIFETYKVKAHNAKASVILHNLNLIAEVIYTDIPSGILDPEQTAQTRCIGGGILADGGAQCTNSNTNFSPSLEESLMPYFNDSEIAIDVNIVYFTDLASGSDFRSTDSAITVMPCNGDTTLTAINGTQNGHRLSKDSNEQLSYRFNPYGGCRD